MCYIITYRRCFSVGLYSDYYTIQIATFSQNTAGLFCNFDLSVVINRFQIYCSSKHCIWANQFVRFLLWWVGTAKFLIRICYEYREPRCVLTFNELSYWFPVIAEETGKMSGHERDGRPPSRLNIVFGWIEDRPLLYSYFPKSYIVGLCHSWVNYFHYRFPFIEGHLGKLAFHHKLWLNLLQLGAGFFHLCDWNKHKVNLFRW